MEQIQPTGEMLTLVHLDVNGRIACIPNMQSLARSTARLVWHRSGDTRAVTCPACKRTSALQSQSVIR